MIKVQLARLLEDRAMRQAELARITGIRPNTISNLCNNIVGRVSLEQIDRICDALDCSLGDLLVRVPDSEVRKGG